MLVGKSSLVHHSLNQLCINISTPAIFACHSISMCKEKWVSIILVSTLSSMWMLSGVFCEFSSYEVFAPVIHVIPQTVDASIVILWWVCYAHSLVNWSAKKLRHCYQNTILFCKSVISFIPKQSKFVCACMCVCVCHIQSHLCTHVPLILMLIN